MPSELNKLKKEVASLRKLAYKDPLTGLYNRRGFLDEGEKIFSTVRLAADKSVRRKSFFIQDLALIFVDIDNFKKINDSLGHKTGDIVLKGVADVLIDSVRLSDLVGRWGGEEMLVLLVGASSKDAKKIAESLRQKLQESKIKAGSRIIKLTASLGVASIAKELSLEDLIRKADKAMYRAKKLGKNRVVII
ncbi:MAG: GGDEF domain-containing protein [Patescibacteria group bacterium]